MRLLIFVDFLSIGSDLGEGRQTCEIAHEIRPLLLLQMSDAVLVLPLLGPDQRLHLLDSFLPVPDVFAANFPRFLLFALPFLLHEGLVAEAGKIADF